MNPTYNETGFEDDLSVIYHRSGLDAVYQVGREDGAGDWCSQIGVDADWFLAHEEIRAALENAWTEGMNNALTRMSNGFDSVLLSDNPYTRKPAPTVQEDIA